MQHSENQLCEVDLRNVNHIQADTVNGLLMSLN